MKYIKSIALWCIARRIWHHVFFGPRSKWSFGMLDQVVCGLTTLITSSLIAHTSSKSEFGLFSLGMTIVLLMTDVQGGLISTPQSIRSPRFTPVRERTFFGSTIIHQVLLAFLSTIGVFIVVTALDQLKFGVDGLSKVLTVVAVFGVFILMREFLRRYLYIKGRVSNVLIFDVCISTVQLAIIYLISFCNSISAWLAHAVIGAVSLFFSSLLLYTSRNEISLSRRRVWPDFIRNFRIGKWVVINNLLWTMGAYAYPWILAVVQGASATAVWAACMSIVGIVNIVLAGILNVLTPNIARSFSTGNVSALRKYVFRSCANYVAIAFILSLIPMLFGRYLMAFLYGDKYAGTSLIIITLALNAIVGAVTGAIGRGLMVLGRSKEDLIINSSVLALVFTLGWWSASMYGLYGAAVSLTLANTLGAIMRFYFFEKASRIF